MTDGGNYYYEVMTSGLKNAGATYQRLMDKIFKGLIGQCVEVYVDDIMVKSDSCDQHIKNLKEVFEALRRTNMQVLRFHVDPPGDRSKSEQMSDDHRDVEPSKHKGGLATHRASYHPHQIRPSVGREDNADGTAAPQDS